MNVIEIKNLTKLYGNGRGIKNLNLTVEQGDIYSDRTVRVKRQR